MTAKTLEQQTLSRAITFTGTGLHSGAEITMTLRPAGIDAGICFVRTDVSDRDSHIPALWDRVVDTRMCTVIGNEAGVTVGTIEHLMAALRGCHIDNVTIELDGPEVPVMDGSSAPFVEKIKEAGISKQKAPRLALKILKTVGLEKDGKRVALSPAEDSVFAGEIEFDHPSIGRQSCVMRLADEGFIDELADARTFGFVHEAEALRKMGLGLGGSLDNAVILDQKKILNKDGLRRNDEFIRHKLLDAVGDLFLAGAPILGRYDGYKGGHALNNELLHKLFVTPGAWTIVKMEQAAAAPVTPAATH